MRSLSPAALAGERPAANPTVSCCTACMCVTGLPPRPRSLTTLLQFPFITWISLRLSMTWTHWRHLDLLVHIYDIVADCSDNVPTRYLVNDACVLSGKPLVSASALRLEGQVRLTLNLNIGIQNIELLRWLYACVCSADGVQLPRRSLLQMSLSSATAPRDSDQLFRWRSFRSGWVASPCLPQKPCILWKRKIVVG